MKNEINFSLKKELYTKDIIYRVCYSFIENYYIFLDIDDKSWLINLKTKDNSPIKNLQNLKGEFNNSLINESFRDSLLDKTKKIKEIIIARALYGSDNSSIDTEGNFEDLINSDDYSFIDDEYDDYLEDPLGIAVPWEEKYKNDNEKKG